MKCRQESQLSRRFLYWDETQEVRFQTPIPYFQANFYQGCHDNLIEFHIKWCVFFSGVSQYLLEKLLSKNATDTKAMPFFSLLLFMKSGKAYTGFYHQILEINFIIFFY